jgi:hypothetical protein
MMTGTLEVVAAAASGETLLLVAVEAAKAVVAVAVNNERTIGKRKRDMGCSKVVKSGTSELILRAAFRLVERVSAFGRLQI